jgi:hypothetical protein
MVDQIYENHGGADEVELDFHWENKKDSGRLSGNIAGLLYLAREILSLADSEVKGKHAHFDKYSGFSSDSDSIIIERSDL